MNDTKRTSALADEGRLDLPVGRQGPERAIVGDVVACDVRYPYQQTLRLKLETQAAADHANKLLALEPNVWRLEKLVASHEPPNVRANRATPARSNDD